MCVCLYIRTLKTVCHYQNSMFEHSSKNVEHAHNVEKIKIKGLQD